MHLDSPLRGGAAWEFNSMWLFKRKLDDQFDRGAYESAVRKVYGFGEFGLALAEVSYGWSFDNKPYGAAYEQGPYGHRNRDWRGIGVVHEVNLWDHRIECDVRFNDDDDSLQALGWCQLSHQDYSGRRIPYDRQSLILSVVIADRDGSVRQAMADAIRDAALSGIRFQHFGVSAEKLDDIASVVDNLRERGCGPRIAIASLHCKRKVRLPQSPSWAWQRHPSAP